MFLPPHFTLRMKIICWVGWIARHTVAITAGLLTWSVTYEHISTWLSVLATLLMWYLVDNMMAALTALTFILFADFKKENS